MCVITLVLACMLLTLAGLHVQIHGVAEEPTDALPRLHGTDTSRVLRGVDTAAAGTARLPSTRRRPAVSALRLRRHYVIPDGAGRGWRHQAWQQQRRDAAVSGPKHLS